MSETELQKAVEEICDELGLLWHHCRDPRHCDGPRGFPDLTIAGPRGLILPELKSAGGDPTADQDLWGWTLTRASHPSNGPGRRLWRLWRPADLESGRIRVELQRITARSEEAA